MLIKTRRCLFTASAATFLTVLFMSSALAGFKALADGSLRRGDEGEAVTDLQELLSKFDCFDYDEFTGYYGSVTEAGVRKFQTLYGLKVDGVAGAETMDKLKNTEPVNVKNASSLCRGMSGDKVEEIQKRLKELGLYTEPEITGFFGPVTEKAVRAFQEASGMEEDGIVGSKTKEAMFAEFKSSTMIPGMKGENVEKLQQRLDKLGYYGGPITGLYGQITQKAVKYFQKLNGLEQDGICGTKTYKAVFSENARTEKEALRNPIEQKSTQTPKPQYTDTPEQSAAGQEKGQAIVDYAKEFLGCKYVYGASGPNTFDCTGLTCYVYKHFGVSLPRSAKNQGHTDYGIKITERDKLMPGDLVFFAKGGTVHHAGIYVGDGNFIHAPYTGTVVRINSVTTAKDFAWGRRVYK